MFCDSGFKCKYEGKSCTLECCEEKCDGCGSWGECSACARTECALHEQYSAELEAELEDYPEVVKNER